MDPEITREPTRFDDDQLWGHPRALWLLFITEMWERFSFYGMRAYLVLYMTQNFLMGDERSYLIYGSYNSMIYLMPIFGGIVADRLLGYRKAVVVGATFMALGHFAMAIESKPVLFLALALIIIGSGFFKPNMSTVVGKLYSIGDPRRDGAYTIFYMSVNVGAWLAPLACGLAWNYLGRHWAFTLAGIGMVLGLIVFLVSQHQLKGVADPPDPERLRRPTVIGLSREMLVWSGGAIAVLGMWKLIQLPDAVTWMLAIIGGGTFLYMFGYSILKCERIVRHRIWVALTLTAFAIVFWAFFEQAGSSITLFTERNVDLTINIFSWQWEVPVGWFQSVNPFFIIVLGMPLAWMWVFLDKKHLNPSTPLKFGLGIMQLGLGFGALWYGAFISQETGMVAMSWLVLGYLLHTTGELFLSPVGLSMMSKLAPANMGAMMMGVWYLSSAFAHNAGGRIATLTGIGGEGVDAGAALAATETVMVYGGVFKGICIIALAVGIFVALIAPLLRRGMHGIH
jgi:POT family proton-dependent oligopeptide transporter